jgi:hypothetical protein
MPKRRLTANKLAANRRNGPRSRGAVTPAGKARATAANLRHGYYAQSVEGALIALGEDPAEFQRRLDSLIDTYQPVDALEMSLVYSIACGLWQMERFHRMGESLAVENLQEKHKTMRQVEALLWLPLSAKMERLKDLFIATCLEKEARVGPAEMLLFEKAQADLPEELAKEVLQRLVRLRASESTAGLLPKTVQLADADQIPMVIGEERRAVRLEIVNLLTPEMEKLEKRLDEPDKDPNGIPAQFERDVMLAKGQPEAAVLARGEESGLRKAWRSTQLLMKIRGTSKKLKTSKMKGAPNKLHKTKHLKSDKMQHPNKDLKISDL